MSFNLVVSTGRGVEGKCIYELKRVGEILNVDIKASFTGFDGLLTATVSSDPVEFTGRLRELVTKGEFVPRFILKVVPIHEVVKTDLEEIVEHAVNLALAKINEGETYKVEVRKRGVDLSRMEIIDKIASKIPRKVKLEHPDKIIQLEVFPTKTGIGVIRESDIFSLLKLTVMRS